MSGADVRLRENAIDTLNEYHDSIGGAPEPKSKTKGGAKGGKRSASNAFDFPAVQPSASKAGKRGRQSNGTTTLSTNLKKGTKDLPEGSWEEHVSRVSSIIEETDEKAVTGTGKGKGKGSKNLLGLLEWNNGRKTQHSLETLRRKCPQRLLDYYEQHL